MLALVSHHLCPYVQRAAIALTEKNVPFERIYVDLSDKPDWFQALSPLGKVPLLRVRNDHTDEAIFESAVILEYLEDTQPNPLHPADPLARARHRSWIEFGSAILNGIARFYNAKDEFALQEAVAALTAQFDRLETELATPPHGPYFAGTEFTLVDAVYGPIFRYFDVIDAIGDFDILTGKSKVENWRHTLAARPSIGNAVSDDYPAHLLNFLRNRNSALSVRILSAPQAMAT